MRVHRNWPIILFDKGYLGCLYSKPPISSLSRFYKGYSEDTRADGVTIAEFEF